MATNRVRPDGRFLELDISSFVKADSNSGTACALSNLRGVIQYDAVSDVTVIDTEGVYDLTVKGSDTGGGNSAVSIGDKLYIDDGSSSLSEGDITPDNSNGTFLGVALESVSGGSTDTIKVRIGEH